MDLSQEKAAPPAAYESSGEAFWEDEYISARMLEAHLNPELDAASRKHSFIDRSADWIAALTQGEPRGRLLDLGCGPGLYTLRFAQMGFAVTGIDLSPFSLAYARAQDAKSEYRLGSYLELPFGEGHQLVTLIYCDYGVLPPEARRLLLQKAYAALLPGGRLILDVFTPERYRNFTASCHEECSEGNGFWCAAPYHCIERELAYPDDVYLTEYQVCCGQTEKRYYIWDTAFTPQRLSDELNAAGFAHIDFYSDVSGACYAPESDTLCAVAQKSALSTSGRG